jgi:hypothetical protein
MLTAALEINHFQSYGHELADHAAFGSTRIRNPIASSTAANVASVGFPSGASAR